MRAFIATVLGIVIVGCLGYAAHRVLQSPSGADTKAQTGSAASAMENQDTVVVTEGKTPSPGTAAQNNSSLGTTSPNALFKPPSMLPSDTREYRNTHYGFALSYPKDLVLKEYDEGSGVRTITFENPDNGFGFQIFIKPYGQQQVNTDVLKIDESSGVMKDPKPIVIAGAKGTKFFGHNDEMDDTSEIWLTHGGYLFEIYTYKPLDSWLAAIMKTWKFL
jgi:hypothetical protein